MRSGASAAGLLGVYCREEGTYRVGYCSGGSPGQVMAGAVDQMKASVRQRLHQTASGLDGHQRVPLMCALGKALRSCLTHIIQFPFGIAPSK